MAYEAEIVDDYITGAEQVGAEPTVAPVEMETSEVKHFGEYEGTEYEVKELDPNHYDDSFYDYGTQTLPPESGYEGEIGPAVPAETGESQSVSPSHHYCIILTSITYY